MKENFTIDNSLIARMEETYGLNKVNRAGKPLKQNGEYLKIRPLSDYTFTNKSIVCYMIYLYLSGLAIKNVEGGYKTQKTKYIFDEMYLKFDKRFTTEELEESYYYLLDKGFIFEIYDDRKYQEDDEDKVIWIRNEDVLCCFIAMMKERRRTNTEKSE